MFLRCCRLASVPAPSPPVGPGVKSVSGTSLCFCWLSPFLRSLGRALQTRDLSCPSPARSCPLASSLQTFPGPLSWLFSGSLVQPNIFFTDAIPKLSFLQEPRPPPVPLLLAVGLIFLSLRLSGSCHFLPQEKGRAPSHIQPSVSEHWSFLSSLCQG